MHSLFLSRYDAHTSITEKATFKDRYPATERDQAVHEASVGKWDAVLMQKLGVFNHYPSSADIAAAWRGMQGAGSNFEKYAKVSHTNTASTEYGIVVDNKLPTVAVDCFLQLLGWEVHKQVDLAHTFVTSKQLPRQGRSKSKNKTTSTGTPYYIFAARVRLFAKLYTLALEHLEAAEWEPPTAAEIETEAEPDNTFAPTVLTDVDATLHQYNMFTKSLQKHCEAPNNSDAFVGEYAKQQGLPSLASRLLSTLGRKSFNVSGAKAEGSDTRMVILCSPPWGWGLSAFDALPETDAEWAVHTPARADTHTP